MTNSTSLEPDWVNGDDDDKKARIVNGHIEYMTDEEWEDYVAECIHDQYDHPDLYYRDEDFE